MRRAWLIAAFLVLVTTPAMAQTATPSPSPTGSSGALATYGALPTFSLSGSATATPAPTIAWPTLTPNPNTTPKAWPGMGMIEITPGGGFVPPPYPDLSNPDLPGIDTPNGFQGINDAGVYGLMVYIIDVGMNFYRWMVTNSPRLFVAMRWFVIIMLVLYGIFWIWKGSRFGPPDPETRDLLDERGAFFDSFRQGSRFYYYTRGNRIRDRRRNKDAGSAWDMAEREDSWRVYRRAEAENNRRDVEQRRIERRLARNERIARRETERLNAAQSREVRKQQARQERIARRELRKRGW